MKHVARTHNPFGGSSLGRRYRCPASYREEQRPTYLPEVPSEAAELGTSLHEAVELRLIENRYADWLEEDDRELVDKCVRFARQHEDGMTAYVEQFLEIRGTDGEVIEDAGGTPDIVYVGQDEVLVLDWKFYHEPLDEIDAVAQIASYVAAGCQTHERARGRGLLYLPRLDRVYEYECENVSEAVAFVESVRAACLAPDAPHNPGSWCSWCTGAPTCPALYDAAGRHVAPTEAKVSVERRVHELTLEQLERAGELVIPIETFAASVRARIKALKREHPNRFPAWSLEERGGKRSADTMALFYALSEHLSPEEYVGCTTVSVKQAEDKYVSNAREKAKEAGEKLTKVEATKKFSALTAGIVKQATSEQLRRAK